MRLAIWITIGTIYFCRNLSKKSKAMLLSKINLTSRVSRVTQIIHLETANLLFIRLHQLNIKIDSNCFSALTHHGTIVPSRHLPAQEENRKEPLGKEVSLYHLLLGEGIPLLLILSSVTIFSCSLELFLFGWFKK